MRKKLLKPTMLLFSLLLVLGNVLGIQPEVIYAETFESGVTVSAQDYEGNEVLPLTAVNFESGADAYDVLKAATDKHDIELETEEFGNIGHMIKKIGDVEEEIPYYWSFNTQGIYSDVGVSSYKVENGDNLTFTFVSMEDGMNAPEITVTVSAVDGDGDEVIEETEVDLSIRSTAYDALYQAAKSQNVALDVSVDENFFTFINNIGETELDETDYWNLSVNNESAEVGAVQYRLDDGDEVELKVHTFDDSSDSDNKDEDQSTGPDKEDPSEDNDSSDQDKADGSDELDNSSDVVVEEHYDVKQHINDLFGYIDQNVTLDYGSEWWVWGLAHTDYPIPNKYIDSVKEEVKEVDGEFKSLELQKIIISLSLLGEDVTDFAGYNLIDLLVGKSYPGINGDIYTLLALDSGHYDAPEGFRENLIEDILDKEKENGGWAFFGDDPTVDITAMVLAAFAPYQENPEVKAATDRAIDYLSKEQEENGGFYEEFNGGDTSESISQVIVALTSLGIDPLSDAFIKEGGNLLEHLEEFKQDDGGFSHILSDDYSLPMSSEQALLAYVAYEKYINDTGLVYQQPVTGNGADEKPEKPEGPAKPDQDPETPENPTNPDPNNDDDSKDDGNNDNGDEDDNDEGTPESDSGNKLPETATNMFNYLMIGLLLIMAGAILLFIKRRNSARI